MTSINYSGQGGTFCLELDRVKLLLEKLRNPDKNFFVIHVAGTNGKGSVCSFLETGLISMGIKCGVFMSPELFCTEDSVRVCGKPIESAKLKNILSRLNSASKAVEKELGKPPSAFETLFAAALVHFKKEKCTHVVLECGMGGAGDATNAVAHSDMCIFSSIGIDHSDYLGDTLAKIAANKCGIIKQGSEVISAEQKPEAEEVILEYCKQKNCQLSFVKELKINRMDFFNPVVSVRFGEIRLSLSGRHQAKNAALAVSVLERLGARDKDIVAALTKTVHKARMEEIRHGIYFDGAHNPDGVKSMVETLNSVNLSGKINFVTGFMADKDISACLDEVKKLNNKDIEFFTTKVHSNPRSETAENLKNLIEQKGFNATACNNVRQAVKCAKRSGGIVFIFGSLYMYKELFGEGGEKRR
ncbi:MAG: hypothetical protein IKJ68_11345 [Clostridia bacterium]|nr:hypothetical protein [Clostridia bacterium]